MKDIIAFLVLFIIIALALTYIIKRKKAGDKCIGCPYAKNCNKSCKK